VRRLIT